jgi:hypothetical protein
MIPWPIEDRHRVQATGAGFEAQPLRWKLPQTKKVSWREI